MERPLLVIMLMGGTGVGKSTLLNALAGGSIAQASFTRPTTRDPVVYYHESIRPTGSTRPCATAGWCRTTGRRWSRRSSSIRPTSTATTWPTATSCCSLLPVADIVLYVGSQEKYHDQLGWDLFLQQRRRRAFAFVLNKWDRCLHAGASGLRPDEDLLRDLEAEGFQNPLLFRTCAQLWVDRRRQGERQGAARCPRASSSRPGALAGDGPDAGWRSRRSRRAASASCLQHLQQALAAACPPDLTDVAAAHAGRLGASRSREEAARTADVLLNTLEPYQREIEHHFALEGQRRFRGLMAGYLHLFTRLKLRRQHPARPHPVRAAAHARRDPPAAPGTCRCSRTPAATWPPTASSTPAARPGQPPAGRGRRPGFPARPAHRAGRGGREDRLAAALRPGLSEVLQQVEQQWTRPTGRAPLAAEHPSWSWPTGCPRGPAGRAGRPAVALLIRQKRATSQLGRPAVAVRRPAGHAGDPAHPDCPAAAAALGGHPRRVPAAARGPAAAGLEATYAAVPAEVARTLRRNANRSSNYRTR